MAGFGVCKSQEGGGWMGGWVDQVKMKIGRNFGTSHFDHVFSPSFMAFDLSHCHANHGNNNNIDKQCRIEKCRITLDFDG